MTWAVGDEIEVVVVTRRGKEAEWIPAKVFTITPQGALDIEFVDQTRQKFPPDTDRIRAPQGKVDDGYSGPDLRLGPTPRKRVRQPE